MEKKTELKGSVLEIISGRVQTKSTQLSKELSNVMYSDEIVCTIDNISNKLFENKIKNANNEDDIRSELIKNGTTEPTTKNGIKQTVNLYSYATMRFDDLPSNVKLSRDLSMLDYAVFSAVLTLVLNGNLVFTPTIIYREMVKDSRANCSKEWVRRIDESYTRIKSTILSIHTGNMGEYYEFQGFSTEENLIYGKRDVLTVINQYGAFESIYYTYKSNDAPLLYKYANCLNQVIRIPSKALNIGIKNSSDVVSMKYYILFRIFNKKLIKTIVLTTIFEKCNISNPSKNKRQELINHIKSMFVYWEDNNIIKNWEFKKKGNKIHAIKFSN